MKKKHRSGWSVKINDDFSPVQLINCLNKALGLEVRSRHQFAGFQCVVPFSVDGIIAPFSIGLQLVSLKMGGGKISFQGTGEVCERTFKVRGWMSLENHSGDFQFLIMNPRSSVK